MVGTFRNSSGPGNTEFRRLTLIHAENGRGKTTLCAIFRSLQSGNPTLVLERKTLDSADVPHIRILINDADVHEFKNGNWVALHPAMEIFDGGFIADNVYSGDEITHDHKKNLCRVVLGTEGVNLAKAFDDQDSEVRAASTVLATTMTAVQALVPRGQTLDAGVGGIFYVMRKAQGLMFDIALLRLAPQKYRFALTYATTVEERKHLIDRMLEELQPQR